ncbi:MAG: hypothetical protein ACREM3_26370 [Candidatus Rokuibacteriota bacterium]
MAEFGCATALLLAILAAATACAGPRLDAGAVARGPAVATPGFVFARDSFAFRNEIRARNPDADDLYANYCFVLARGLRQFFTSVRFDPAAPRITRDEYVARVRQVAARPAWGEPLPPDARVVIPGYASLRDFSRAEEDAVKEGLGGRFWTFVHWTNWRITLPVTGGHQEGVAAEIVDDLRRGRLVQLLVTNWPKPELNHTVVVYAARAAADGLALEVWDPNDPDRPGRITFERASRRFVATRVYDTGVGPIRVFRMYYSWLL